MMRPLSLTLALSLVACGGASDADPDGAAPRPHVLLICLDTVRPDHVGFQGYTLRDTTPHLDALAARGLVFSDATAASGWTKPSVPSFLTGTRPAVHGVYEGSARRAGGLASDRLPEESVTLAERFREGGYRTGAFIRNAQLRPGLGFEQGFETYRDQVGHAGDIRSAAAEWVGAEDDGRPYFLYVHVLDAHWPYDVPDEAALRWTDPSVLEWLRDDDWREVRDAINDGDVPLDDERRDAILALYDGSLRFADEQIGALIEGLEADAGERGLVVGLVTDHGEEFLEHGRLGHGHGLWENLTRALFVVAGPGVPTGRVDTPVGLPDLHPTLLAAAGLEPSELAARFAVDRLAEPDRELPIAAEHKGETWYEQSLRWGDLKLVRRFRLSQEQQAMTPQVARLVNGGRWEAELDVNDDGFRIATQFKPRDEDEDDPVELKGVLGGEADAPVLHGVPLRFGDALTFSGTLDGPDGLVPGVLAKLEGFLTDDVFVVEEAKGYAPDEEYDPEIRGPVTHAVVDDGGRSGTVWLGGIPVRFDADVRFKGVPEGRPEPLLDRSHVADILAMGGDGSAASGFEVVTRLFDLTSDPAETAPVEEIHGALGDGDGDLRRLATWLDRQGAAWAEVRLWSSEEGSVLDEEEIEALRALGYVR